ncbi:MAG: hypothetical protein PHN92_06430 [Geobacter sp.]|nr:hypothetical protein [Geobacter sp.]
MLSILPSALFSPTSLLEKMTQQQDERLTIAAHLLAATLISASLIIYPGSFLATPALMVAVTLLLAPPLGFILSLRTDLEWWLLSHGLGIAADKRLVVKSLLASQLLGLGLISLLISLGCLALHHLTGSENLVLLPISLGMLLFLDLLWLIKRLRMLQLESTPPLRITLISLVVNLLWCSGIALVGWFCILGLRHSLLADLNLMMMFF